MTSQESSDKFAYLNHLSTEELQALLRADLDSPEEGNEEVVFYILGVIASRSVTAEERKAANKKSWERFQKYYNTPDYEGKPLYDSSPRESAIPLNLSTRSKSTMQRNRNVRRTLIAAAIVAVIIASMTIPVLGHPSILHMVASWTTGQFSFQPNGETTPDHSEAGWPDEPRNDFSDLQEALDYYQIDEEIVPKAIPNGFSLQEVQVHQFSDTRNVVINGVYISESENIFILVIFDEDGGGRFHEKDSADVESYVIEGIVHYILKNGNDTVATWYTDALECSISTTLSIEELKQLIDSIY